MESMFFDSEVKYKITTFQFSPAVIFPGNFVACGP